MQQEHTIHKRDEEQGLDLDQSRGGQGQREERHAPPVRPLEIAIEEIERQEDEERRGQIERREGRVRQQVGTESREEKRNQAGRFTEDPASEAPGQKARQEPHEDHRQAEEKEVLLGPEGVRHARDRRRQRDQDLSQREVVDAAAELSGLEIEPSTRDVRGQLVTRAGVQEGGEGGVEREEPAEDPDEDPPPGVRQRGPAIERSEEAVHGDGHAAKRHEQRVSGVGLRGVNRRLVSGAAA